MNPFKALISAFVLAIAAPAVHAEAPQKMPYKLNASYLIAFSPIVPLINIELPTGHVTVLDEAEEWILIQYSTFKNERNKNDAGKVESVETVHKAWINLEHIVVMIESPPVK